MSVSKAIQDGFKLLGGRKVSTFAAEVISVNKAVGSCTVRSGELDYTDVALSATIEDNGKRCYLFPKVGSFVFVSPINEDIHRLYVEFFSEIEEVDFNTENSQLRMNDEGFLLKKQNETLKKLMVDLLQEIQKMKFTTNTGSTILLVNKPEFIAIEDRFKDFLR